MLSILPYVLDSFTIETVILEEEEEWAAAAAAAADTTTYHRLGSSNIHRVCSLPSDFCIFLNVRLKKCRLIAFHHFMNLCKF